MSRSDEEQSLSVSQTLLAESLLRKIRPESLMRLPDQERQLFLESLLSIRTTVGLLSSELRRGSNVRILSSVPDE